MVLVTLRVVVEGVIYYRRVSLPAVPRRDEWIRDTAGRVEAAVIWVEWHTETKTQEPMVMVSLNGEPSDLSQWSTEL